MISESYLADQLWTNYEGIPVSFVANSSTRFFISSYGVCSALRIVLLRRIVVLVDFELTQIRPLIPAASSYGVSFDKRWSKLHFSLRIFLTRLMLHENIKPSWSSPSWPFFPAESTHTSSASRSGLAKITLQ